MKLIIDIDDEMVCNDIKNKALEPTSETDEVIINALYNGTPVTTDGDLISRSELKREFAKFDRIYIADTGNELVNAFAVDKLIDNAPTVEQEVYMTAKDYNLFLEGYKQGKKDFARPQGEWQPISEGNRHECNKCKDYAPSFKDGSEYLSKFCPNCGAKMKGGTKE